MNTFVPWLGLLLTVVGPPMAFAAIVHVFERTTQRHLAERFGWGSVMWTGWLGTPIHELSHVAMCIVFRHRVDAVVLFEPDPASGRLGYVQHSWRKGNWFEELGNVFIGLAPLLGGSAALLVLLMMFYPDSLWPASDGHPEASASAASVIIAAVSNVCSQVLQAGNLLSVKFWVFVYLILCVGSHMAPSWSDYRGTGRGAILAAILIGITLPIASLFITNPAQLQITTATVLSPLFALFAIVVVLGAIATLAVVILTSQFPRRFEIRRS